MGWSLKYHIFLIMYVSYIPSAFWLLTVLKLAISYPDETVSHERPRLGLLCLALDKTFFWKIIRRRFLFRNRRDLKHSKFMLKCFLVNFNELSKQTEFHAVFY